MEFCPKCGAILVMKVKRAGCPKCNYVSKDAVCMEIKEEVCNNDAGVRIASSEENINPVVEWDCPDCKHKKAEFWMRQMRSGDEPESKFYKCCKCSKTCRVDD